MRIMTVGKVLGAVVEFLASVFIILQFLGISEISVPWSKLSMENTLLPLALVGFFIFPLWLGYEIRAWRSKRAHRETLESEPKPTSPRIVESGTVNASRAW